MSHEDEDPCGGTGWVACWGPGGPCPPGVTVCETCGPCRTCDPEAHPDTPGRAAARHAAELLEQQLLTGELSGQLAIDDTESEDTP